MPAKLAPRAAPAAAISSSAWNECTPNDFSFDNSCRISLAGVIGYAPRKSGNTARRDAATSP
jgi:hypothetical protein